MWVEFGRETHAAVSYVRIQTSGRKRTRGSDPASRVRSGKPTPEVRMLLAIAAVLLIIAVIGGIAVHPLLFLIAILAVVALVAGR